VEVNQFYSWFGTDIQYKVVEVK